MLENRREAIWKSRGFTLVELLVVITIIGILIALLLPAVQAAREAARSSQCANNIRQLGLAILNYEAAHNMLPISVSKKFGSSDCRMTEMSGKGWIVSILPQLEQQALYDQFVPGFSGDMDSGGGLMDPLCRNAMKTLLPVLQCPSDPATQKTSTAMAQWSGIEVATTNYKGVLGETRVGMKYGITSSWQGSLPDCHSLSGCNGLFYRCNFMDRRRVSDIKDGLSNTLMVGEALPEYNYHSAAFYSNGDWASCNIPLNYLPDPPTPDDWWNVMGFCSRHPNGAHFCLADGSARFLNETIGYDLYRALSTRAGDELAQAP